jgi:trimeric autotransporter adhesin
MKNQILLINKFNSICNSLALVARPRQLFLLLFAAAPALGYFTLVPLAHAVSPPPDGGYPNMTTAEGEDALFHLTTGLDNTANGFDALFFNTTGSFNTASGYNALLFNTTGFSNTATGSEALANNTTGTANTATGVDSLEHNSTGGNNTASGFFALFSNTSGFSNVANGVDALFFNTTGSYNTANGVSALMANTIGNYNTATGQASLPSDTTGTNNTAEGHFALRKNTTGSFNIALGDDAGSSLTTGSNNIDIGNRGIGGDNNKIRIGTTGTQTATFIAGISGTTIAGGVGVIIDTQGHLGTVVSSERFKDKIRPMDKASEAILSLHPVTFRYRQDLDPDAIPQFGLVAEQVEKIDPDLVARDEEGKPYTVRYEAVNAMLLNEFLKEHRKVEEQSRRIQEQEATITQLEKGLETVAGHLKAQDTEIAKVSAQVELTQAASRVALNHQ